MEGIGNEIRKSGVYRKLKTSKKKFFIIREPGTSPACVEYYDSERKFKALTKPKRSINLNSCFSINPKQDAKYDHIVILFTKDDCLGIVFDTKEEQTEWLGIMLALQQESGVPKNTYDNVWQVNIKPEGLANGKCLHSGIYRLCLSKKSLSFIRLCNDDADIEFQLATIRRCGHSKNFFFIESGNAAPTGAGELWMQVEDAVIANNIHDTLLKAMKANGKEGDVKPTMRARSHTMDKTHKPTSHMSSMKRNMSIGESSTLPRQMKAKSLHVSSEHPSSPARLRHSQSPSKSFSSQNVRPKSTFVSSTLSVSPANSQNSYNTLSGETRCRADSMESHGSLPTDASSVSDDIDVEQASSGAGSTNSEMSEAKEYFAMDTVSKEIILSVSPDHGTGNEGYMRMNSPLGQSPSPLSKSENNDKYITMSPGQSDTDSSYLDMHTSSSMYCKGSSERLRPDKVPSLLSDSESIDDFPKRAYSVGSKPVPIQSGIGESYAYMEMTKGATDKGKHKANSAPHLVDEIPDEENHLILLSSPNDFPGQDNSRSSTPRSITPSLSKTCDQQDLLMEMDFQNNKSSGSHESLYESHSRTSSFGSKDFRSRTSSGGSKDFHSRTSSFSADFRDRTDSADSMTRHGKGCYIDPFRMRTQTVCQDSLRPRTSSFGPSDMRPRSSSHGNSRFKELSRRLKEKALQHRILDQSKGKKIIKQASKENMSSTKESAVGMSGYIDIDIKTHSETCNKETITRQRKLSEPVHVKKDPLSDEEYIIIKPVTLCSDSEATSVNQPRLAKHVYISPKVETITDHIATSPHIKKSSVNRRDYPSGYFKHSSSSESVSSTSSSDFNTKTRIHKSSPQSMPPSSMSEYFEVIPQNSPCYPSNLVGHTSKTESLEDSYIVYSPNALESTPDSLKNFSYLEKVHTPVNEESHLTFLSMNKIVSPIREEDNEAIFGPKPKVLSKDQTVLKCLKHEYVNVKFDGNKDINTSVTENTDIVSKPKNKFNNMPRKNVLCGTKQTISQSVKYKEEPIDSKKMDERHIEKSDCEVKILMKDLHEYCEISVGVSKDKTESTDLSSISDVDTRYHEMTFPELKKTLNDQNKLERSAKIFPDSTTQKVCLGKSQVKIDGDSCASSVYSDNSNISSFKNDQKVTAPIDVFNLGAKPCSSPVDIKLPKKLSSSPSSDGSSSSQTSTVYLSNDNRKLSQGSVTSLSSLDNQNTRVQLSTTGTVQNLANKPGDRRSYQEHVAGSGDSTNFNLCSRQLSRSSLGSIESQSPGLNYATLDLSTSLEEPGFSTLTSSQISPGGKSMHPHDEHSKIISYAEIDFEKSVISVTSNLKIEEK